MKKYLVVYNSELSKDKPGFETVDAGSISERAACLTVDANCHLDRFGFRISDEEVLTFRRHLSVWETFVAAKESFCLVIECNINLTDSQIGEFVECIPNVPGNWDVFFPYEPEHIIGKFNEIEVLNPTRHERYDYQPYLFGYEWGNSIYALTKKGARKLLNKIKHIRLRLDDSILELAIDKKATVLFSEVDFFDINSFPKKQYIQREKLIIEAVSNYNLWNQADETDLCVLLKTISKIAKDCDIKLILQGGTHLGYVRHGGKMPWDDDVDLGIYEQDFPHLRKMLDESFLRYSRLIEGSTGIEYYKIWLDNGKEIEGHPYCFPFVDLWLFNVTGEDLIFKNGIICPKSANYPFEKVVFEGETFWLVGNSLEVLDSRYKDWRTKIRIYNWNHKVENGNKHRLEANIKVDEGGKLINFIVYE